MPSASQAKRRTYLYKLTSDRGGAPCATPPETGHDAILTLAICKPAIRRTAQPGDRILGITSHSLANREGYPLCAVIYAAIVQEGMEARDYFAPASPFTNRPDCIYAFHQQNGRAAHTGRTNLHRSPANFLKDLGAYPYYRNGRVLLAHDFRYFGSVAVPIPPRLQLLYAAAETLGQGHRVYTDTDPESREADILFRALWKLPPATPQGTLTPTPTTINSRIGDPTLAELGWVSFESKSALHPRRHNDFRNFNKPSK